MEVNRTHSEPYLSPLPYIFYMLEGILFGVTNFLICCTILRHPVLRQRKEYITVAASALADFLNEIGFIAAGVYRSSLLLAGEATALHTSFYCMLTVHNLCWSYTMPLAYFMLLCISIDRFMSVHKPLQYRSWSLQHSFKMIGFFYLLPAPLAAFKVILSYRHPHTYLYEAICLVDDAIGNQYYIYLCLSIQMFCSSGSVLLYMCIPFMYRHQRRHFAQQGSLAELSHLKTQKKLLITLGISTIFTFFLMVVPSFLRFMSVDNNFVVSYEAVPWAGVLMNTNPAVNTFLFIFRHQKFRQSFLSLVTCKPIITSNSRRQTASFTDRDLTVRLQLMSQKQ